ncbi:MAG: hypothetical protein AB8B69_10675 [Chitinophagales bacterium]
MDEFNLDNVWKDSENQAGEYYKSIEGEVEVMARKSSHSILTKLKRTILWEWGVSVLMLVLLLPVLYYTHTPRFYLHAILCSIIFIAVWIPYQKMLKKIKITPTQNILHCIESYIEILEGFIKQIKALIWVFFPIALVVGLFPQSKSISEISWSFALIMSSVMTLIFALVYWFLVKLYIPKLYGQPKKEFEELLERLKSEE